MSSWIPLLVEAVRQVIREGRARGLPSPGDDEIEEITRAVNEAASHALMIAIITSARGAEVVAEVAVDRIESLGEVERCPTCGGVMTIRNGDAGRSVTCDRCYA